MEKKIDSHEDLREIQERYSFIVNAYGEMMTLINRDYVYELVNDSWCKTFGKSREDFIGKTVSQIWGEKRFNTDIKRKIDQCLEGKIFTEEDSFIIAGGERRYYEVTYFPFRAKSKMVSHAVGVTNDITARKKAEIALRKSEKKLRELNTQKDQYLSIINSDLDQASKYVNSLLPDKIDHPRLKINWKIVPSAKLGGDSFGYHWIDQEHMALYMLDVTGHGVGSALHSVSVLNMLKFETLHNTNFRIPHEVLHGLNQVFRMTDHNSLFITMWYMVYNKTTRELSCAGAGHPPLILFDEMGNPDQVHSKNTMVGIDDQYEFTSDTFQIEDPITIFLYTDGAYEAERPDGSMMNVDDLVDLLSQLRNNSDDEIEALYDALLARNPDKRLDDDFTIMKISLTPAAP